MRKRLAGRTCSCSVVIDECLDTLTAAIPECSGLKSAVPALAAHPVERNERALVAAAQAGDAEAIRTLYDATRNQVWKLLLYMLGDPQQAQDVFQCVFMKFFRGLSGFRHQSSLLTWLYRIARNECLNHHRRRRVPFVPLEEILGSRDEIDSRPAGATRWERDRVLRQAVRQLPPKMREVIILKYVEGLSYEEIGRALDCAAGTVASRLSRALSALGERLEPYRKWL